MSTEEDLEVFTIKTSDIVFGRNLQTIVPKLWDSNLFSDVTLVLGSTKVKSHRVVLALLSPKLKAMLDEEKKTELVLEGNERALLRAFEFLYKGQIKDISEDEAIQLLDISCKYEIEMLKDAAGNYLADRSTEENLSYLLNIANKYSSSTLLHRCGQFIAENFSNMPKSILNDFEPEVWKGILMSKKIKVESEENLFDCFEDYLSKFKSPQKEEIFTDFIKYFHFHEFPGEFLVKIEEKYGSIPSVHDKLHHAYRSLVYAGGKGATKDQETREYDGPNWSWIGNSPLVFSEHNRTVRNSQSQNRTAVANKPLKEIGHKVWSLRIDLLESGGWIGIGLGAKDSQTLSFTGSEQMFMFSANSYKWPLQQMVGFAFAQGDVITVEVSKNELVYYKNGTNTGKTITGWSLDMHPLVTVQRAQVTLLRQYKYKS